VAEQESSWMQVPWNGTSERVTIPSTILPTFSPKGPLFKESSCLGLQLKMGGKFHLKLNMGERPIANKYREGKMKSTLKRESKVREIVERETLETSQGLLEIRGVS
jgi:hypothetical protein